MSDGGADAVPEWVLDRITDKGVLNLNGEDLGGEIPSWVYQLTELRALNLSNCRLSGTIPAEAGQAHEPHLSGVGRERVDRRDPA